MYYIFGIFAIIGLIPSLFFFSATIFDFISIHFPFVVSKDFHEMFLKLYGNPKVTCLIIFILSGFYLLLFRFCYPYLESLVR